MTHITDQNIARITAYLAGELPPAEVTGLELELAENPGLQELVRTLRQAWESVPARRTAHIDATILAGVDAAIVGGRGSHQDGRVRQNPETSEQGRSEPGRPWRERQKSLRIAASVLAGMLLVSSGGMLWNDYRQEQSTSSQTHSGSAESRMHTTAVSQRATVDPDDGIQILPIAPKERALAQAVPPSHPETKSQSNPAWLPTPSQYNRYAVLLGIIPDLPRSTFTSRGSPDAVSGYFYQQRTILSGDTVVPARQDTSRRPDSTTSSKSENELVSDSSITKAIRVIKKTLKEIGNDTLTLRKSVIELWGPPRRLLPGEDTAKQPSILMKAIASEGLSKDQMKESSSTIMTAWTILDIERKRGVNHSKEERVNSGMSVAQIDIVRKRFAEIDTLVKQISKGLGMPE